MTPEALLPLILALPPVHDWHGRPIPRPERAAKVFAAAASETQASEVFAAYLDVLGAHESGYNPEARGDHEDGVAKSCGTFQTPCAETPGFARCSDSGHEEDCRHGWRFIPSTGVVLAQARLAIRILLGRAMSSCPDHPVFAYASGHCAPSWVALRYEDEVRAEARALTRASP